MSRLSTWNGAAKLVFRNCIVGGVIDNRFMPAILKGIMEKMESGSVEQLPGSRYSGIGL
ncbi:MAG: hypothetical protein U5J63_03220 [Fodinibius sp.]|nr:hypothetical protein [Fodinibius sp.]